MRAYKPPSLTKGLTTGSDVAIRALAADLTVVFTIRRINARLVVEPAPPKNGAFDRAVLLAFVSPQATEELLFVLPLRPSSCVVKEDKGAIEIKGRVRCLIPMPPHGLLRPPDGFAELKLRLTASAAGASSLVTFDVFELGRAERRTPLPCNAASLDGTEITNTEHRGFPSGPPLGRLLGFRDSGKEPAKVWPWRVRFDGLPPPANAEAQIPHARLVLSFLSELGLEKEQTFTPLDTTAKAEAWPKSSEQGIPVVQMSQRLPVADQWGGSAMTRRWTFAVELPGVLVHDWWNRAVTGPVTTALGVIQQGRPFTTLPLLPLKSDTLLPRWDAIFHAVDFCASDKLETEHCRAGTADIAPSDVALTLVPQYIAPSDRNNGTPVAPSLIEVSFPGILTKSDAKLQAAALLHRGDGPHELQAFPTTEIEHAFRVSFRLEMVHAAGKTDQAVRMGAMDLMFPPGGGVAPLRRFAGFEWSEKDNRLFAVPALNCANGTFVYTGIRFRQAVARLPVKAIGAGSQDDMVADSQLASLAESEFAQDTATSKLLRPSRPLVLQLTDDTAPPSDDVLYTMLFQEVLQERFSQTIQAQIFQSRTLGGAPVQALILDDQPFLVCLVASNAMAQAADLELTTEIANWSNREGHTAWEVRGTSGGFSVVLPPQGVGEAMHRRAEDDDVTPGQPIDFRFTPPAVVRLRPGDTRQRFGEPAWNLRRLLNTPAFFAGVPIDRLDFELFYGVAGQLEPRGLRLAELTARLGVPAGPLPQEMLWRATTTQAEAYDRARKSWTSLLRALRTRLAVYEVWSPARELTASDEARTAPLTLTDADGLRFALRPSAKLRYPIADHEPKPLDGDESPVFSSDGLKGGWSWGFESRNILESVRARPRSTSASITGLFLSSFGGWGQQKASFDNGRTTIHSMVSMGRTATINIERIGRIGVFWNRAKHVIVYERTVAASRQFYLEQHALTGNPVLRKVDEYVELLEDERAFPDKDAPASSRGFVVGLRFAGGPPARIRVNSRWGHDVGEIGWRIPLWVRGAVPTDVYPKPAVYFLTAGATPEERIPVALDNPDDLCFYTSTEAAATNDSDTWAPVEGVDFAAVREHDLAPKPFTPTSTDPRDYKRPDTLVAPALGQFSFTLEPAPATANLVADRAAKPIRAVPRSATLMRGLAVAADDSGPSAAVVNLLEQRGRLLNAFAPILQPDGRTTREEALLAFKEGLEQQRASWQPIFDVLANETALCDALASRVARQFDLFATETRLQLTSALQQALSAFLDDPDTIFSTNDLDELRDRLRSRLQTAAGSVSHARAEIRRARGTVGEVLARFDNIRRTLAEAGAAVTLLVQEAIAAIGDLPDWNAESRRAAAAAVARLSRAWEKYVLPGPVDFVIGEAVRGWTGRHLDSIRAALGAERQSLVIALNDIAGKVATAAAADEVMSELERLIDKTTEAFDGIAARLESDWVERLEPLVETALEAPLDQLHKLLDDTIAKVDASVDAKKYRALVLQTTAPLFDELDLLLDQVVPKARATLVGEAKELCAALLPGVEALKKQLAELFDGNALAFWDGTLDDDARQAIEAVLARLSEGLGWLTDRARASLPELNLPVPRQLGDNVVRMLRAFGDVPRLPNLDFNLPQVGYYFHRLGKGGMPGVDLSPVAALVNKFGNALNALDISLPATHLLDRLVPASLPQFDLSKLFPNFAGLKLDRLFKGLRAPGNADHGVRVTHGIDESTRTAWLQADVDTQLGDSARVFEIAGVRLTLKRGRFRATSRIEARPGEPPRQQSRGSIQGDWAIDVGGMAIADLTACTLRFDEAGAIHFDVTPAQVKLQPPLDFLSRLFEPFNNGNKGFSIAISPQGVRVLLMLPLPDMQGGTFGVAHLSLGFLFELLILPKFMIRTGLMLSRREKPFTLTVFVLGGAGSLLFGVTYVPDTGEFITTLNVALYASASIAISLGPISGGIYAYVGVTVDYTSSSRGASSLYFGLRILFVGEVCLLGFISVNITLGLEAVYKGGNNLLGRGFISLSIKVCWCLTITVDAAVEYEFGSGESSSSSSTQIQTAADEYLAMF